MRYYLKVIRNNKGKATAKLLLIFCSGGFIVMYHTRTTTAEKQEK